MNDSRYFLSKDCFVCKAQNYWIVLNAKRDRYLCVTDADLTSIGRRLHGWKYPGTAAEHALQPDVEATALVESLILGEIITCNADDGKPFVESDCPARERSLELPTPLASMKLSVRCVTRFFSSCAKTDWRLRARKISHILARIERRRLSMGSPAAIEDAARAARLIAAFRDLRPLYPRPYLCLFDSLALLEFLASFRLFPRVVFGVIADPFQAHCWLQDGSMVLNDDLERVERYIPILSL